MVAISNFLCTRNSKYETLKNRDTKIFVRAFDAPKNRLILSVHVVLPPLEKLLRHQSLLVRSAADMTLYTQLRLCLAGNGRRAWCGCLYRNTHYMLILQLSRTSICNFPLLVYGNDVSRFTRQQRYCVIVDDEYN